MNKWFSPVHFTKDRCIYKIGNTLLEDSKIPAKFCFQFASDFLNNSFYLTTDNLITATLIDLIWNVSLIEGIDSRAGIIVEHRGGYEGRYFDLVNHCQLLSSPNYTPFTIVKQSLRWEFAFQCSGRSFLPLHGVIIKWNNKYICISGYGKAGKTFLSDWILKQYPNSRIVVDDWSLINVETKEIHRLGDEYLHARGSSLLNNSFQLQHGNAELVEICDNDTSSEETRFLIRREELPYFFNVRETVKLDTFIFIRNPFLEVLNIETDRNEVKKLLESESNHFWDDSNFGLPGELFNEMYKKWKYLLNSTNVSIVDGHRGADLDLLIEEIYSLL